MRKKKYLTEYLKCEILRTLYGDPKAKWRLVHQNVEAAEAFLEEFREWMKEEPHLFSELGEETTTP